MGATSPKTTGPRLKQWDSSLTWNAATRCLMGIQSYPLVASAFGVQRLCSNQGLSAKTSRALTKWLGRHLSNVASTTSGSCRRTLFLVVEQCALVVCRNECKRSWARLLQLQCQLRLLSQKNQDMLRLLAAPYWRRLVTRTEIG